jgi:hypothetical protein
MRGFIYSFARLSAAEKEEEVVKKKMFCMGCFIQAYHHILATIFALTRT